MKSSRKRKYGKAVIRSINSRRFARYQVRKRRALGVFSATLYRLAQLMQFCAIGVLLMIVFVSLFGLWPQFNGYMYNLSSGLSVKPLFEISLGTKFFMSWLIDNLDPLSRFFLLMSPVALMVLVALGGFWLVDRLSRLFQYSFDVSRSIADEMMSAILWASALVSTWIAFDPHVAFIPMLTISLALVFNVALYMSSYAIKPKLQVPKWRIAK